MLRTTATDPDLRLPAAALPFLVVGAVAVVAGGVVAAVTRPTGFEQGSWVAAYLVLVGGVALIGLGVGQTLFAPRAPTRITTSRQLGGWVLSSALVVTGTLASTPVVTAVGGLVLLAVLVTFITSVRGSTASGVSLWLYRAVLVVLLVSIPVGLAMAWQRHG
mgnify:CR=1 FL=1